MKTMIADQGNESDLSENGDDDEKLEEESRRQTADKDINEDVQAVVDAESDTRDISYDTDKINE